MCGFCNCSWPTQEGECERYLPTTNPKEKLTMVVCNVVCYSGDEDVLVSTKAAMIKSQHTTGKRKSQRRGALPPAAKKSCGVTKNSIAAKATGNFNRLGFSQFLYYTLL